MHQDLLSKYFKNKCTPAEKEMVEAWLLNTSNKAEFDDYVLRKWDTFEEHKSSKTSSKKLWWAAAASLILAGSAVISILVNTNQDNKLIADHQTKDTISQLATAPQVSPAPTIDVQPKPPIQYEHKINSKKAIAQVDTSIQETASKSIKASKIANFMINEVQLAKFTNALDSGTMVMNIKANQASFQEIATILRKKYGVILEPCSDNIPSATYTARLEKTSIPDLLNDMSEKMLFTYTIQDNLVKICFN